MNKFIFALLVTLFSSSLAQARGPAGSSTVGLDIKYLASSMANTILFGWRYLHNPSREFSLGGVGNLGQSTGTNNGSLAYGGLFASWNAAVSNKSAVELGLMAGGAGGTVNGGSTYGGVCLEPSLAYSFSLGQTVGAALSAGYLYIPTSKAGSGFNGGLRIEFSFDSADAPARTSSQLPAAAPASRPLPQAQ